MTVKPFETAFQPPRPHHSDAEHGTTADGLAYAVSGPVDGDLIVLVHGAMDRMAGMHKLARRLDDRCRVVRYDRRGYGLSAPHPGPFDIAAHVDDVVSLLDRFLGDGRRAVLVGHSIGGDIVLAAAQRATDQVGAVVAFEPPQSWEPWWPGEGATAGGAALGADPHDAAEAFMRRLIGDRLWERLPQSTKDARRSEGPALVGELRDLCRASPFDPAAIEQPVILGYSEFAKPHHHSGTASLAISLANATLVCVPGASHGAHASHPELFVKLLVEPALRAAGFV